MKNNLMKNVDNYIERVGLENVKAYYNSKTGTCTITGECKNQQYTTTISNRKNGGIKTETRFQKNLGKEALRNQIKELRKDGYKQTEIASMLGISQPTVSNYLSL